MPYSLRVKDTKRTTLVADNTEFLDVEVEILNGNKVVETKKFGYSVETTEKEIKEDLDKVLQLYVDESAHAEEEAEKEKVKAASEKTITNIKKLEIHEKPSKKARR